MIAVIADDFTGAAEIGGLGLKYGLKVAIESEVTGNKTPDLLIIVADTRSMKKQNAIERIKNITNKLIDLKPSLIYKKLDSVLRGYVYDEIEAQKEIERKTKAIIIAGNPSFNRLIIKGKYYIDKVLLAETSFATDPEFPAKHSDVVKILGGENVVSCKIDDKLPNNAIILGDVESSENMTEWLSKIDSTWVVAGGASFFDKILMSKYELLKIEKAGLNFNKKTKGIYFFGSTYPKQNTFISQLKKTGIEHVNLSEEFFATGLTEIEIKSKAKYIANCVNSNNKVLVSSVFNKKENDITPDNVRIRTGQLAKYIFEYANIEELYIEGGATASSIFSDLNMKHLEPTYELAPGIIQMKVENKPNLLIITKPGSYAWPERLTP